jgi:SnoaL-like domain
LFSSIGWTKLVAVDLVALEEIRQVQYRYPRCVDLKLWDDLAEVFTPDATVDYGTMVYGRPLKLAGRDEIIEFLRDKLGPDMITVRSAGQPEISIDGDEATETWSLQDTVFATAHRLVIKGAAFYTDRYRRGEDGRWRTAHTGYLRTYEAMLSLDDLRASSSAACRTEQALGRRLRAAIIAL